MSDDNRMEGEAVADTLGHNAARRKDKIPEFTLTQMELRVTMWNWESKSGKQPGDAQTPDGLTHL